MDLHACTHGHWCMFESWAILPHHSVSSEHSALQCSCSIAFTHIEWHMEWEQFNLILSTGPYTQNNTVLFHLTLISQPRQGMSGVSWLKCLSGMWFNCCHGIAVVFAMVWPHPIIACYVITGYIAHTSSIKGDEACKVFENCSKAIASSSSVDLNNGIKSLLFSFCSTSQLSKTCKM